MTKKKKKGKALGFLPTMKKPPPTTTTTGTTTASGDGQPSPTDRSTTSNDAGQLGPPGIPPDLTDHKEDLPVATTTDTINNADLLDSNDAQDNQPGTVVTVTNQPNKSEGDHNDNLKADSPEKNPVESSKPQPTETHDHDIMSLKENRMWDGHPAPTHDHNKDDDYNSIAGTQNTQSHGSVPVSTNLTSKDNLNEKRVHVTPDNFTGPAMSTREPMVLRGHVTPDTIVKPVTSTRESAVLKDYHVIETPMPEFLRMQFPSKIGFHKSEYRDALYNYKLSPEMLIYDPIEDADMNDSTVYDLLTDYFRTCVDSLTKDMGEYPTIRNTQSEEHVTIYMNTISNIQNAKEMNCSFSIDKDTNLNCSSIYGSDSMESDVTYPAFGYDSPPDKPWGIVPDTIMIHILMITGFRPNSKPFVGIQGALMSIYAYNPLTILTKSYKDLTEMGSSLDKTRMGSHADKILVYSYFQSLCVLYFGEIMKPQYVRKEMLHQLNAVIKKHNRNDDIYVLSPEDFVESDAVLSYIQGLSTRFKFQPKGVLSKKMVPQVAKGVHFGKTDVEDLKTSLRTYDDVDPDDRAYGNTYLLSHSHHYEANMVSAKDTHYQGLNNYREEEPVYSNRWTNVTSLPSLPKDNGIEPNPSNDSSQSQHSQGSNNNQDSHSTYYAHQDVSGLTTPGLNPPHPNYTSDHAYVGGSPAVAYTPTRNRGPDSVLLFSTRDSQEILEFFDWLSLLRVACTCCG